MKALLPATALTIAIATAGAAAAQPFPRAQERRPGQSTEAYRAQEAARWGRGPAWSATRPRLPGTTDGRPPPVSGYRPRTGGSDGPGR